MFAPGVHGGPPGCSVFVDQVGHLAHLHARDTFFCLVSRAPLAKIEPFKKRVGWNVPWFSSSISQQIVVVIGGSSGIGYEVARG